MQLNDENWSFPFSGIDYHIMSTKVQLDGTTQVNALIDS